MWSNHTILLIKYFHVFLSLLKTRPCFLWAEFLTPRIHEYFHSKLLTKLNPDYIILLWNLSCRVVAHLTSAYQNTFPVINKLPPTYSLYFFHLHTTVLCLVICLSFVFDQYICRWTAYVILITVLCRLLLYSRCRLKYDCQQNMWDNCTAY